jgi:hypothetical protein
MSNTDRLEEALRQPDAFHAALALAILLRDSGMAQNELTDLFDKSRSQHAEDADERQYNVVLDVMDRIAGYCSPAQALYVHS